MCAQLRKDVLKQRVHQKKKKKIILTWYKT